MNSWSLYDKLISAIPESDRVTRCQVGPSWTAIETAGGLVGVNATQPGEPVDGARYVGMPLREAAALIKSWRFGEAALGVAALNAAFNRAEDFPQNGEPDAFLRYQQQLMGKKVACIGHFAYLERRLQGLCDLYILERAPRPGDYPDPAAEYLLPEMDTVFITGSALANKTLPRLMTLSRGAFTVLSGPSVPMCATLLDAGADALCGFCVTDRERLWAAVADTCGIFTTGRMVCLEKE